MRAITSAHSKSSSNRLVRFSGINMIHINDNISPNDYLTSVLILLAKSTKYRFKHKVRRATLRVITWKTNDNHGAGRHNIRLIYFFLFLFCFHSSMASCVVHFSGARHQVWPRGTALERRSISKPNSATSRPNARTAKKSEMVRMCLIITITQSQ